MINQIFNRLETLQDRQFEKTKIMISEMLETIPETIGKAVTQAEAIANGTVDPSVPN